MVFIVKKKIGGREYYYLNKSIREGKKVRTKTIAYLGKTRADAEKKAKEFEKRLKKEKKKKEKKEAKEKTAEILAPKEKESSIEEIMVFCKRKGFVYPSGEIYGGLAGFWDFGHLGTELKNNIKEEWWKFHVRQRNDIVGIDSAIITNPKVWEASGHVSSFSDIAVACKKCGFKTKVDKSELGKARCERCKGEYESKGNFSLMFTTNVGPIEGESIKSYLRPETAQLIFADFKFIHDAARLKLPFGIAQVGKAFRNEIAPRDFLFRMREFEQMEIEYFVDPKEKCPYKIGNSEILILSAEMQEKNKEPKKMSIKEAHEKNIIKTDWHAYWLEQEFLWFVNLGANPNKFRIRQHLSDEKSHYAIDTWDLEYKFPFGWKELQGMANRTDFDLKQHEKFSKTSMEIIEEKDGKPEKILPHVICEPSQGVERAFLVFMFDSYCFDEKRQNIVLRLHPKLSPIKAAVFPIVKKPEYESLAKQIVNDLKQEFNVNYDISGSIGRRYARNDEAGTPFCITIDNKSPKNKDATIRDRDTTLQIRVKIKDLKETFKKLVNKEIQFEKAGKLVVTRVKEI